MTRSQTSIRRRITDRSLWALRTGLRWTGQVTGSPSRSLRLSVFLSDCQGREAIFSPSSRSRLFTAHLPEASKQLCRSSRVLASLPLPLPSLPQFPFPASFDRVGFHRRAVALLPPKRERREREPSASASVCPSSPRHDATRRNSTSRSSRLCRCGVTG